MLSTRQRHIHTHTKKKKRIENVVKQNQTERQPKFELKFWIQESLNRNFFLSLGLILRPHNNARVNLIISFTLALLLNGVYQCKIKISNKKKNTKDSGKSENRSQNSAGWQWKIRALSHFFYSHLMGQKSQSVFCCCFQCWTCKHLFFFLFR